MINDQLQHERLANPVALGVLSPDAISSTAYGSEQVMIELLPAAGMAAFALLLPITGVILLILVLVAASYRQVVMVYTRSGGSYVVARENFGPKIAQIAAASLLIDYVVTVAVQCAAGTVAVVSAIPALGPLQLGNHRRRRPHHVLRQPARIAGSRASLCAADLFICRHGLVDNRRRSRSGILRGPTALRSGAHRWSGGGATRQRSDHGRDDPHRAARIRQWRLVADRRRGDFQHGQQLPQARRYQCPQGPHRHGVRSRIFVSRCRLACAHHPRLSLCQWVSVDAVRDCPGGLRQRGDRQGAVLSRSGSDRPDPLHRWQHQLQRLSRAGEFRCRGQLPSAAVDETGPSAGVLQRHHHADRAVGGTADRDGRIAQRAGAVLRDRGVHRLLDGRLRHDQTLADPSWARLAIQAGDQPVRGPAVHGRGGHFRGRQVHRRGLARRRCLPDSGASR